MAHGRLLVPGATQGHVRALMIVIRVPLWIEIFHLVDEEVLH